MQFLLLIGRYEKYSPLKPLGQMNRNLVGSGEDILEIARKNNFLW
jgi:hypothetical protein